MGQLSIDLDITDIEQWSWTPIDGNRKIIQIGRERKCPCASLAVRESCSEKRKNAPPRKSRTESGAADDRVNRGWTLHNPTDIKWVVGAFRDQKPRGGTDVKPMKIQPRLSVR